MISRAAIAAAISLLALAPLTLCSCGDKAPSTADSVGTPAGWTGKTIKMNAAPPGLGAKVGGTATPAKN